MGRWLAAPALCAAACLSAPPGPGSGPAPDPDGGAQADAGGLVDPGNLRFRSIGPTGAPLGEADALLSDDGRVLTVDPLVAAELVRGVEILIDGERSWVAAIAGGELLLERALPAAGQAVFWHSFPDLDSWQAARGRDLPAQGETEVAVIAADLQLAALFNLDRFTTDPEHRVIIRAAEGRGHTGLAGTGVTIRSSGSGCLRAEIDHVTFEGLALASCGSMTGHAAVKALDAVDVVVDRLLVHDYGSPERVAALSSVNGGELRVRNTIVSGGALGLQVDASSAFAVDSCTFWNLDGGAIEAAAGATGRVRNTIIIETDGSFPAVDQDHNVVDFVLAGAAMSSAAELFRAAAAVPPDLHLSENAAPALAAGADLRALFDHDVDGEPRGEAWDIGADQRTPAGE